LNGAAYPGPGLFSKFFSMDMQGLVEVVQDTVGRHDTFNLACTARYYEDMGYFGHVNCSDNFNDVLSPFEIEDRRGWPAINFFFNTSVDDLNVIHFDQPWSQPGDYVLLRALTDLVCASSSCPCDIDAANGWESTDIHVRVYPKDCFFKKAVAYRMTPDAPAQLTKETGFHSRTSALTRNFNEYRGYWLPTSFNNHGAIDEYWACRERAVVMDLSPLRKFEVLGPDSEELMQRTFTRNVRKLAVGQVAYGALCYEHGGMIDDGTLFRLGPDNFRWVGGDDYGGIWLREQAEKLGLKVWVKSATDQIHNIAVQGPLSREVLKKFVWTAPAQTSLEELAWFRFAVGRIDDFHGRPIVVSRTGYTGELGYEIFCHPDDAPLLWDKVMVAGEEHRISPLGLDALDIIRIEAGLIFAGYEFDEQTDPFEAGIGFSVALKHDEDFIGRSALEKRKASPQRQLVGLELVGNEEAAPGDCVHIGRAHIGDVTSACRSPILKKNIALARVNMEYAELGTEVEIGKLDGHQKRLPARIVRFPFYDPDKTRVRGYPSSRSP
jgi:aminomethyltransferase